MPDVFALVDGGFDFGHFDKLNDRERWLSVVEATSTFYRCLILLKKYSWTENGSSPSCGVLR